MTLLAHPRAALWRTATYALIALTTPSAFAATSEPRAVAFTVVAKAALPDPAWSRSVCALAKAACAADAPGDGVEKPPKLYQAKGGAAGSYYAILPGPQLLQLSYASGAGWKVLQQWDFSDYLPAERVDVGSDAAPLEIYPALYPLGGTRYAVAVVAGWSEGYSGGGGHWDNVDMVELQPNGAHAAEPVVATLPFGCGKSIRACFFERDYKHSPHCSEDFDGYLLLRFVPRSSGQLDWIATWKETHWPGLVPKSKTTHSAVSVTLPLGGDPAAAGKALRDKISFCEPTN